MKDAFGGQALIRSSARTIASHRGASLPNAAGVISTVISDDETLIPTNYTIDATEKKWDIPRCPIGPFNFSRPFVMVKDILNWNVR
jgi:hypothetical protein